VWQHPQKLTQPWCCGMQAPSAAASEFQIVVTDPHKTGDNVGVRASCAFCPRSVHQLLRSHRR